MSIIILDAPYAKIEHLPEIKTIMVTWQDAAMSSADYRNVFNNALEYAAKNPSTTYLADIRKQRVVSPDDRKWFESYALPAAIERGVQRGAIVFAGNVFTRYYLNNISQKMKSFNIPMKFFSSVEEATEWIKTVQ